MASFDRANADSELTNELGGWNEDISILVLDNGVIVPNDLAHGIYEIVTREQIPRILPVFDPAQTLVISLRGSALSIEYVANNTAQMLVLQGAYQTAFATFLSGQGFAQQFQALSSTGSSTISASALQSFLTQLSIAEIGGHSTVGFTSTSNTGTFNKGTNGEQSFVTLAAIIKVLPISNDQHGTIFLGPGDPGAIVEVFIPASDRQTLVSVRIRGLPDGATITDGHGNVYSGSDITILADDFRSGLWMTSSFTKATLLISATVLGAGGKLESDAVALELTLDLSSAVHWINSDGGDWHNGDNWSTGSAPIPFQDVILDAAGSYTISVAKDVSIDSLLVAGNVTLSIASTFSITTANTKPLSNAGTIIVGIGGHLIVGNAQFANSADNSGTLQASGGVIDLINLALANAGKIQSDLNSAINLQTAAIDGGQIAISGLLQAIGGTTNSIANATILSNGTLLVSGTGTVLTLINDTITSIGSVVITFGSTLNFQSVTLSGGTLNNAGLLQATGATTNTIENVLNFSNSGTLLATSNSMLLLVGEFVSNSGTIQIESGSSLGLQNATVSGGTILNAGILGAYGSSFSVIQNVASFINGGTLVSIGNSTLALIGEAVSNSGTIQIDFGSAITLQGTFLIGGTIANSGLLQASGVANVIQNVASFTNSGTLLATGNATLTLINETVNNTGKIQVDAGSFINLQSAAINGGLLTGAGTFAIAIGSNVLNGVVIDTGTTVTVNAGTTLTLDGTISGGGQILVAGASTIIGTGTVLVPLNAAGLANNDVLTLAGSAAFLVINLIGDLNASGLTGALTCDDRRRQRQQHHHHDRVEHDLDHRRLRQRHRDGARRPARQRHAADAGRGRQLRGRRAEGRSRRRGGDRHADGDDRRRQRRQHHHYDRLEHDLDHRQLRPATP